MSIEQNRDLPEWLRAISIFVLTFALLSVLSGLAGAQIDWGEDPSLPPEVFNRP